MEIIIRKKNLLQVWQTKECSRKGSNSGGWCGNTSRAVWSVAELAWPTCYSPLSRILCASCSCNLLCANKIGYRLIWPVFASASKVSEPNAISSYELLQEVANQGWQLVVIYLTCDPLLAFLVVGAYFGTTCAVIVWSINIGGWLGWSNLLVQVLYDASFSDW